MPQSARRLFPVMAKVDSAFSWGDIAIRASGLNLGMAFGRAKVAIVFRGKDQRGMVPRNYFFTGVRSNW
ncbi:hypothetical protein FKX85_20040 [Echinicola soli]|uniref:Uncharacterized protein n=1 Tax=Echinicola soli TaxID=2591634 RepID=A0A514CN04_9BACT|nr:hypothetical protein [Echinicola soli]QDH81195.1 hypothetical protein FKX85_20040 [Echinicola soli]